MASYEIIKLKNQKYDFLVIATDASGPFEHLEEIECAIGIDSVVLFDLSLTHGVNSNRYIQGLCHNSKFDREQFVVVASPDKATHDVSSEYF